MKTDRCFCWLGTHPPTTAAAAKTMSTERKLLWSSHPEGSRDISQFWTKCALKETTMPLPPSPLSFFPHPKIVCRMMTEGFRAEMRKEGRKSKLATGDRVDDYWHYLGTFCKSFPFVSTLHYESPLSTHVGINGRKFLMRVFVNLVTFEEIARVKVSSLPQRKYRNAIPEKTAAV